MELPRKRMGSPVLLRRSLRRVRANHGAEWKTTTVLTNSLVETTNCHVTPSHHRSVDAAQTGHTREPLNHGHFRIKGLLG